MANRARVGSPFGQHLRRWRTRRGLSQLELASRAATTARHISFVETGRSRPGRDMVLRLASALDIPLSDRNALLVSAGLPPEYPTHALDDETMRPIAILLERILTQHEPYPAWIYARGLRALRANAAAEAFFPGLCALSPRAIVDLWFDSSFRAIVENWDAIVWAGIDSLRRETQRTSDTSVVELLDYAEARAKDIPFSSGTIEPDLPVVCPRFRIGDRRIRTISTVLRFDTAVEITASELRVELMFPADDASAAFFRDVSAHRGR